MADAPSSNVTHPEQFRDSRIEEFPTAVVEALADDLNTPAALAALHGLVSDMHRANDPEEVRRLHDALLAGSWLLGLFTRDPESYFKSGSAIDAAEIERLIAARNAARAARRFKEADEIRADLLARGIELEDTRDGTRWKVRS